MEFLQSLLTEAKRSQINVVCGFPGVGKSTLFKKMQDSDVKVLDSDSSKFDKKDFPENYIQHIKKSIDDGYIILVSSHDAVRNALVKENIPFVLAYPNKELKDEYLQRYKDRGSPDTFIKILDTNWDKWVDDCDNSDHKSINKLQLQSKEYLDWNDKLKSKIAYKDKK